MGVRTTAYAGVAAIIRFGSITPGDDCRRLVGLGGGSTFLTDPHRMPPGPFRCAAGRPLRPSGCTRQPSAWQDSRTRARWPLRPAYGLHKLFASSSAPTFFSACCCSSPIQTTLAVPPRSETVSPLLFLAVICTHSVAQLPGCVFFVPPPAFPLFPLCVVVPPPRTEESCTVV
ncbi:hypothetical protein BCV70DRAFT_198654 [Testicularia cyperi]|uniref:Uncharacterized protein n=1 Tax=Testicularia cyperi TaxID=1882483 RepID=A0A317XX20_9BASI|nr:hypothetical protein BCV70DRAFT_198654 [Testicularia cyperi]